MGAMTNSVFESTLSQLLNAPRLSSVTAAAGRVTTTVQQLNQQGSGYVNQLWDVTTAAVQLTHGDDSVSSVQHAGMVDLFSIIPKTGAKDRRHPPLQIQNLGHATIGRTLAVANVPGFRGSKWSVAN